MINVSDTQRMKVWHIEKRERYALVRMSSSRKERDSGNYKSSTWSFVRFVGNAFKKIDTLAVNDTIVLKGAGLSKEPYTDNNTGEIKYPQNPQFVVFNWEPFTYDDDGQASSGDKPPVVASSDDDDLPF